MNYKPKFIEGLTVDKIDAAIEYMNYCQYTYGAGIDRPRLWDLEYTKRELLKRAEG